jgi:hypothetical protein
MLPGAKAKQAGRSMEAADGRRQSCYDVRKFKGEEQPWMP